MADTTNSGFEWETLYTEIAKIIREDSKRVKDKEINEIWPDTLKGHKNPFSFFATFNYDDKKRLSNLATICEYFKIKTAIPTVFHGIPSIQLRAKPFEIFKDESFCNFFDWAMSNNTNADSTKTVEDKKSLFTKTNTALLFAMNPAVFLPLDSNTRAYLREKLKDEPVGWPKTDDNGGKLPTYTAVLNGTAPSAKQYLCLAKYVKEKLKLGELKTLDGNTITTFAELSYEAVRSSSFSKAFELLESHHQIILTGAPGTGKTFMAKQTAEAFVEKSLGKILAGEGDKNARLPTIFGGVDNFKKLFPDVDINQSDWNELKKKVFTASVQFHPGYDYSDFVIGLKPILVDEKTCQEMIPDETGNIPQETRTIPTFRWKDGIFKTFVKRAKIAYDNARDKTKAPKFVFLIDEINRADLSRVFGELFSLLEEDYRYKEVDEDGKKKQNAEGVTLPNGQKFVIPENLYIIGTMNDIDRSVESMDFALRRRFGWMEVSAKDSECILDAWADEKGVNPDVVENLKAKMETLNKCIRGDNAAPVKDLKLGSEYELGGAYFKHYGKGDDPIKDNTDSYKKLWDNHIRIILAEYLRDNREKKTKLDDLFKAYSEACASAEGDND